MKYIHINCDLGEGGRNDAALMSMISACNIACGGHAGTVESMRKTVVLALENRVQIGVHPSYPDKENFGRKSIPIQPEDLKNSLAAQMLSLKQIAESEGGKLNHIKPHGALYNDAAKDVKIAELLIASIEEFDKDISLYAPENSIVSQLARGRIKVIFEAFSDRNYLDNYSLVPRGNISALITQKEEIFRHLFGMFTHGEITSLSGKKLPCLAASFCLHGDTPNSVEILQYLKTKLWENNIKISRI